MNAFDASEESSVDDVVDEWRASTGVAGVEESSSAHAEAEAFKRGLVGIVRAFFACKEDGRAGDRGDGRAEALGDALRVVASVRASLEALLLLRGGRAQLVLEALQLFLDRIPSTHRFRLAAHHVLIKLSHRSRRAPRSLHISGAVPTEGFYKCGGFADVYRGLFAGQPVAIKKLRSLGGDDLALKKLFREALVWYQLHHTNVLPFLGIDKDLFPDRPLPSLITPWMERGTLSDYIKSSEYLASRDELSFLNDIAAGLSYLHSMSVIHGDLTPDNVLISHKRSALLADFGLTQLEDCTLGGHSFYTSACTPRWTSPQRLQGDHTRKVDDIYSFGCIAYHLHFCLLPFHELSNANAIMMRVMNGHRPPRPALVEHNSAEGVYEDALWDWIKCSWHADASVRPLISDISSAILNFRILQRWPTPIPPAMKIACGIPRGAGGCPGSISMFDLNIHRLLATHLHVHHDIHHSQEQELPAYCTERGCRISQSRTFHLRHTIHDDRMPSQDLPEWPFLDQEGQSSVTVVTDPSRGMSFPGASVEATTPLDANLAFAYAPASFNGESLQPPLAPNMTFPSESHLSLDMSGLAHNDWGYSPLS